MKQIEIIVSRGMFGADEHDSLLDAAMRLIASRASSDENEWSDKYGTDFENDTFLMHHYCWCEREGECPWCTGCGFYQNKGLCQACCQSYPHLATCYQTEMNTAKKAAGLPHILNEKFVDIREGVPYEESRRIEDKIYDSLCSKHGLDRNWGAAVHCDCAADESRKKAIGERGCDYHFGRGIFARFEPYALDHKRGYYDPPNFWYKPTNFRVNWYKYIGRDMKTNRGVSGEELNRIVHGCLFSLPTPNGNDGQREAV